MNRTWLIGGLCGLVVLVAGIGIAIKIRRLRHPLSDPLACCAVHQDPKSIKAKIADADIEERGGVPSLVVKFQPGSEASVAIQAAKPWNWSGYGSLTMRVTNPSPKGQRFFVRLDQSGKDPVLEYMTGFAPPNSTQTFLGLVDKDLTQLGIQQLALNYEGMVGLVRTSSNVVDLSQVGRIKLSMSNVQSPTTLVFDTIKLGPPIEIAPFVDKYGQNRFVDWPGKAKSDSDLTASAQREQTELAAAPANPTDAYGGLAGGPKMAPKGHFYTAKWGGRWLFVTPLGNPMFLTGINGLTPYEPTIVDGRRQVFADLPSNSGPLGDQYLRTANAFGPTKSGETFNFYGANLERKYGSNYRDPWKKVTAQRMKSWGFNTAVTLLGGGQKLDGVPYVLWASTTGQFARVSSGDNHWSKMPDPFDPAFGLAVNTVAQRITDIGKGDPYCIGYTIDNELSWGGFGDDSRRYSLAYGALSESADKSPAKKAFLESLQGKYGTVDKLNAAWKTNFKAWSDLERPVKLEASQSTDLGGDMSAFVTAYATRYFSTVKSALKAIDPDRLYFGCRMAFFTPEVIKACLDYVDVVSMNLYTAVPDPAKYGFLKNLEKPVIFSEFGSGATDRGAFGYGIYDAGSQTERADALKSFMGWCFDSPSVAGCSWFQYVDQPATGRFLDGQNCGIGLVDITDQPYPELIHAARSTTQGMYRKLLRVEVSSSKTSQ